MMQRRHRLALPVRGPFRRRAQHGRDQPGLGRRRLERLGLPFAQCLLNRRPVVVAPEQLQDAVAVVREVGVESHFALVAGVIDAGDLVPGRRRRPAVHTHVALAAKLDRRMAHMDGNGWLAPGSRPCAQAPYLGSRQCRGGDRDLRGGADAEGRRQCWIVAGKRHAPQRRRLAFRDRPQVSQCPIGRRAAGPYVHAPAPNSE
jgi:hypothetical protein